MNNCLLCSFRHDCQPLALALYARTPILFDILLRALGDSGISYKLDSGVIYLDNKVSDVMFAAAMNTQLSLVEMQEIRVTRSRNAEMLDAPTLSQWLFRVDTAWFDDALKDDRFTNHFQPIVDFTAGLVHGHECLVRLFADRAYSGGEIISAALSRGHQHVFDSYARQLSVRCAGDQDTSGTKVFINFMPSSIYDPAFCMKSTLMAMEKTRLVPNDIVFEVIESESVSDPNHLRKICEYYRDRGFGFALDDVGTGSNSLQMMCDLNPDYIKIDKSLIQNIQNSRYRVAIQKLVDLADEFGVRTIAEGIENLETAQLCAETGIHLMQGYHFGRPAKDMVTSSAGLIRLALNVAQPANTVDSECRLGNR